MSDYSQWFDPKAGRTSNAGWESFSPQDLMALYEQYLKMTMQAEAAARGQQAQQIKDSMPDTLKEQSMFGTTNLMEWLKYNAASQALGGAPVNFSSGRGGGSSSESSPAELPSDWRFGPSATAAQNNMMTSLANSGGTLGQAGQGAIAPGSFPRTGTSGATTIAPQSENTSILDFIRKFYPTGSQWVQNYLPEKPLYGPRR